MHQPAATGRPAERYLHPLQRTLQPMDGARSFQTPLQDACEALEWDCRLESCRDQLCDSKWPFFWNPTAPAARNAMRNTMVFSKRFKGPSLLNLRRMWLREQPTTSPPNHTWREPKKNRHTHRPTAKQTCKTMKNVLRTYIYISRPRGVTVSTLDSESSDRGSNPREAFLHCNDISLQSARRLVAI